MKSLKIYLLIGTLMCQSIVWGQNIPNNTGLPSGTLTGIVSYPLDFNASPNSTPTRYNYTRVYTPLVPLSSIPHFDNTSTMRVLVNTTYKNGWEEPLINIARNNSGKDIVTPVDSRDANTAVSYLPFSMPANTKFVNDVYTKQSSFYNLHARYGVEGATAYTKSKTYADNGVQTTTSSIPGKAGVGFNKGLVTTTHINGSSEVAAPGDVFVLKYSSGNICKDNVVNSAVNNGVYNDGQLIVTKSASTDHGQIALTYANKAGQVICKRVLASTTGTGAANWLSTYYVYNDLGQLTHIVPPKASQELISNSCLVSPLEDYCFRYEYDNYSRLIRKQVPGQQVAELTVYDKHVRSVMFQTPLQQSRHEWSFTVLDIQGRPVIGGIYAGTESESYWRDVILNKTTPVSRSVPTNETLEYWLQNGFGPNDAYPTNLAGCDIQLYNYYDDYAKAPSGVPAFNSILFAAEYLTGTEMITPEPYSFAEGKLVASKVKLVNISGITNNFVNQWTTSVFYYDEKGNLIQEQNKNPWNTTNWDNTTFQYDFAGHVVLKMMKHFSFSGSGKPNTKLLTKYTYGINTGRLEAIAHKVDNIAWHAISDITYNDLGQVSKKVLGNVEKQDLEYDMGGRLNGINPNELGNIVGPGANMVTYASKIYYDRYFGMPRYDGQIAGFTWQSENSNVRSYGYEYDLANRLTHAEFRDWNGTSWSKATHDFTVSNLTYDVNGNIMTMNQRGYNNSMSPDDIDVLSYNYSGNQLAAVSDAGVSSPIHDFVDGNTGSGDYQYDASGNMTLDNNKGITAIEYNQFNKPVTITTSKGTISNIYSANGTLVEKSINKGAAGTDYYYYWGPFVFKNNNLESIMHEEGRIRKGSTEGEYKYDFFVKDHLQNVRTVVEADVTYQTMSAYSATFEILVANVEESIFEQIGAVRDNKPLGTPVDLMSGILNGSTPSKQIGAAILLHGMAGDQLNLEGFGYYDETEPSTYNTYAPAEEMMASLTNTLTEAANNAGEGGVTLLTPTNIGNLLNPTNYTLYDNLKNSITDPAYPRAYLNYLVFDELMNLRDDLSKVIQLKGTPSSWKKMSLPANTRMEVNGYVLAYFSNESAMDVAVDNMQIIHYEGSLKEEQHYYPHGMIVDGGTSSATNYLYRYLTTTNKLQQELDIELMDFNARNYDQQIGRFVSIDPLADQGGQNMLTPYHFNYNNPANFIDPLGLYGGWVTVALGILYGGYLTDFTLTASRNSSVAPASIYMEWGGANASANAEWGGVPAGSGGGAPSKSCKGCGIGAPGGYDRLALKAKEDAKKAAEAIIAKQNAITQKAVANITAGIKNMLNKATEASNSLGDKLGEIAESDYNPFNVFTDYMDQNHMVSDEEHYSYEGKEGLINNGIPTMIKTAGVLSSVVGAPLTAFGWELSAGTMATATTSTVVAECTNFTLSAYGNTNLPGSNHVTGINWINDLRSASDGRLPMTISPAVNSVLNGYDQGAFFGQYWQAATKKK